MKETIKFLAIWAFLGAIFIALLPLKVWILTIKVQILSFIVEAIYG
jgi:hypothetical protein